MSTQTSTQTPHVELARRTPADKHEDRRNRLADSALATLAEVGYARASLREIAQNSEFSHGVVHYYFADKIDLITYCVRRYKTQCATRYDDLLTTSTSADELARRFAAKLAETLREEAPFHRLWYDLRSASMFEGALRDDVAAIDEVLCEMIWQVVQAYAALADRPVAFAPRAAYGLLDGLFEQALHAQLRGRPEAADELTAQALKVLPLLLAD